MKGYTVVSQYRWEWRVSEKLFKILNSCVFLYCNRQVHRYFLITLYEAGGEMGVFWVLWDVYATSSWLTNSLVLRIYPFRLTNVFRPSGQPWNLSLSTLQFLQEAKENILYAKVFPFGKTWSSLCGSSVVLHCITLIFKNIYLLEALIDCCQRWSFCRTCKF
jgi:hypothetical protein